MISTPNESSDIQLLSMNFKTIDEDEDKEQKDDHGVEKKEAEKETSDGKSETKEVNKEDDITVGTFGFTEKVADLTASKVETPTTVTESEKKEDQSKKEKAAKVDKNEKLVEVVMIYCWLFPYLFPVSLFLVTYLYFLYLECALRQLDLLF